MANEMRTNNNLWFLIFFEQETGTLVAEYECLPGWEMLGNSTLPCIGDSWLNVQHICAKKRCEVPLIENSIVISDSSEYMTHLYGDSINITCKTGQWRIQTLVDGGALYCGLIKYV